ncbi:hypothetical protein [Nitrospirillum sp. BR 11828]|uniref:hypothetical protein n=1 Tax=Nitrospirillum sp. BR 11828 TaxID=3104325 RepID=UPI002ACA39E0|nr:hypothetical protein [Nitrospirillum sp. BR 11828]MDZ5648426.1 hypothetical protein [Nitrospirillum sp. BR 11828]
MDAPTTIQCLMPPWRRVLVFQSFRQFLTHVASVSAASLAGMLALSGLTQLRGHDPLSTDVIAGALIGTLVGSLRMPYQVMPCQWRLAAAHPGIIFNKAPDILAGIRYRAVEHGVGRTLYRLSVPWYMRWPDWGRTRWNCASRAPMSSSPGHASPLPVCETPWGIMTSRPRPPERRGAG